MITNFWLHFFLLLFILLFSSYDLPPHTMTGAHTMHNWSLYVFVCFILKRNRFNLLTHMRQASSQSLLRYCFSFSFILRDFLFHLSIRSLNENRETYTRFVFMWFNFGLFCLSVFLIVFIWRDVVSKRHTRKTNKKKKKKWRSEKKERKKMSTKSLSCLGKLSAMKLCRRSVLLLLLDRFNRKHKNQRISLWVAL